MHHTYLYFNTDIHFGKPLKMLVPGTERKLRNKNRVTNLDDAYYITLQNILFIYTREL